MAIAGPSPGGSPSQNGRTGNGEYEDDDEHEYDGCHLAEL